MTTSLATSTLAIGGIGITELLVILLVVGGGALGLFLIVYLAVRLGSRRSEQS